MKTQVSGDAVDLKVTYILHSSLFLLVGSLLGLAILFFESNSIAKEPVFVGLSIGFVVLGCVCIFLSNKFVPYCYKIEVEDDTIYISKSQTVILTEFEETITVPKSQLVEIKRSPFGFEFFFWINTVFYLKLREKTEYGDNIAFVSKMKLNIGIRFDELELLKPD